MDLESIPGVGEKTAAALRDLEAPQEALANGDVAKIARAPGISPGRAARIARNASRAEHDDPGGFLATDRAREIYQAILELLQDRTVTEYAAHRMEAFYPARAPSRIEEVRTFVADALERTPTAATRAALEEVAPPSSPDGLQVRDRCLATTDAERYAAARKQVPELSVELFEDRRELAELARGYATVIVLDESFAGIDIDGDLRVDPDALEHPETVVPERTLKFFAHNREQLKAAIEVHRQTSLSPPCDLDELEAGLAALDAEGEPVDDEELNRLTHAIDGLDDAIATGESIATERLRESIREQDVTVEGADLLSLVERGAGIDSLLARELETEYDRAVTAAREHVIETLALREDEATAIRRAFPDEPTFPIEHREEPIAHLREELTAERDRRATRLKQTLAADLTAYREAAETLLTQALELDVELAIAQFAEDYGGTLPTFHEDGPDVRIEGGRSPLLDVPPAEIEPVEYAIEDVVVLSGVNSGGKTSLLDLLAAVVILAHMGLPVPAETAQLRHFDRLHYHAKTQGTLDAGAFESTIREFAEIATSDTGSLVLVDELEAITEPGASAKIIAGILEHLSASAATAVVVSHLAAEIQNATPIDLRIDGIHAEGLEDGQLVVDRSPRIGHLARSTPELIVAKLAEEREEGFYTDLLEKFE